jgi:hypothetical protein
MTERLQHNFSFFLLRVRLAGFCLWVGSGGGLAKKAHTKWTAMVSSFHSVQLVLMFLMTFFQGHVSLQSNKTTSKSNPFSSTTMLHHQRVCLEGRRQDVSECFCMERLVAIVGSDEGWRCLFWAVIMIMARRGDVEQKHLCSLLKASDRPSYPS